MSWDDTLEHVKDLQKAGFTREQAEAIVSLRYRTPRCSSLDCKKPI
jgi:hypothetical protein